MQNVTSPSRMISKSRDGLLTQNLTHEIHRPLQEMNKPWEYICTRVHRNLGVRCGECHGFRGVQLLSDDSQSMNLVIAHHIGLPVVEQSFLISSSALCLDRVWSYSRRFCCEQLFRDKNPASSSWRAVVYGIRGGLIVCCW